MDEMTGRPGSAIIPELSSINSDECLQAILKLKGMREALQEDTEGANNFRIRKNADELNRNSPMKFDGLKFFDDLSLIDLAILDDDDCSTWLLSSSGSFGGAAGGEKTSVRPARFRHTRRESCRQTAWVGEASAEESTGAGRRVTRNSSYIIHRSSSPENLVGVGAGEELNTTFTYEDGDENLVADLIKCGMEDVVNCSFTNSMNLGLGGVDVEKDKNISMEELHKIALQQEQTLKMTPMFGRTFTRKKTHVVEFPILDACTPTITPSATRTSSTDTYCVAQSNSESPTSSGLSSPVESQSYEDIPTPIGDALRRSLPNLSVGKLKPKAESKISYQPPLNELKHKNYHISDSKLVRPSKSSLSTRHFPVYNNPTSVAPKLHDTSNKEMRLNINHIGNAQTQMSNRGFRDNRPPTGTMPSNLPAPKYSSIPRNSTRTGSASLLPVPNFGYQNSDPARLTSRIPAFGGASNRQRNPKSQHHQHNCICECDQCTVVQTCLISCRKDFLRTTRIRPCSMRNPRGFHYYHHFTSYNSHHHHNTYVRTLNVQ